MIRNSNVGLDHLRGLFAKQSIATMDQLKKTVGTVADLTVYRKLRELDYSPGASKWNPIEHRLFSEISKNWAGRPLDSYETVLNFIRTTKTKTGLKVNARLVKKQYAKGIKISDPAMTVLNFKRPTSLPKWNYTLRPSKNGK